MRPVLLSGIVFLFLAASAVAAGFVHNANFLVFAPAEPSHEAGQALAEQVIELAEQYRQEIAQDWLGEEMPTGMGRTTINVSFDPRRERALTWAKDDPRRILHAVYIRTTLHRSMQAIDEMLPHEMVHVVLATRFPHPNRLPPWIEEGIASRYDDAERVEIRKHTAGWWAQTGNWPELAELLRNQGISANSAESYAAAASLVDFLLTRADKATLFRFARDGQKNDWDSAMRKHYQIDSTKQLQTLWEGWMGEPERIALQTVTAVAAQ